MKTNNHCYAVRCFRLIVFIFVFSGFVLADEYKVAVRAHHGIDYAIKQWQPTIDVINRKIPQHKFILLPILSLKEITERAGKPDFDFVLTNPSSFVEMEQYYGAKSLATLNNKRANTEQDRFGSVIFTHVRNVDILSLKGKTLMAVSEQAFGGWRMSWLEMLEQGFDPYKDLKELKFTKTRIHPDVVRAVQAGDADAGVVRTDRLERMESTGKIDMRYFRILNEKDVKDFPFFLSTRLYPEWSFSVLKHVPEKPSKQLADVLFLITKDSYAAVQGEYIGWKAPRDYSSVRELMKRLKIGPYEKK